MAKPAQALTLYAKENKPQLSPISESQLLQILQKTPKEHIYKRPGKGGGQWEYVTGTYVKKVLNYVFGWNWNFEVKEHGKEGNSIWVLGKLTIETMSGIKIVKEQFGRADLKSNKSGGYLDYGNDLKAATTDALKKCASELGIASDIYGKEEFKQIETVSEEPSSNTDDDLPATDAQLETLMQLDITLSDEPVTRGQARKAIKQFSQEAK